MDEPESYLVDVSDLPGAAEQREAAMRRRAESRRRYHARVEATLLAADVPDPAEVATAVLADLFDHPAVDGSICRCWCHPRLPESDLHDHGFDCICQRSAERRRAAFEEWKTSLDAYWASPAGEEQRAAHHAQEAELDVWLADHPDVCVNEHGGWAPEQWTGSVDGRSFYFRERHDVWRIELDLRPGGRCVNVWKGVDASGDAIVEPRELTEGDVIAEGTTGIDGYGSTPAERIVFIVNTIRSHTNRPA